jgi:chromosomal replication initiator protein
MNSQEIWNSFLTKAEEKVGGNLFDLWFKPMKLIGLDGNRATIEIPNRFFKEWIEDYYPNTIEEIIGGICGRQIKIIYNIKVSEKEDIKLRNAAAALENRKNKLARRGIYLNPKYTFESFVVGSSNQLANAAARKVAETPGFTYNPLFIYGGVGLGKTHLINAIGNFVVDTNPALSICYLSSEQFISEVVASLRHDKMADFKEKFRNLDVLLIDDIQFIAKKAATQEEFFHTFNSLYEKQKQIVISSDRAPAEIYDITDRLRSRFNMGLIVDIQVPEVETKMAIIFKKADKEHMKMPEDVAYFIASRVKSNIRDLEGCLIKLGAYCNLTETSVSLEVAKEVLRDLITDEDKPLTVDSILKVVSDYFGLKVQELKSKRRTKELVTARQIAMYIIKHNTKLSLSEIGKHLGGKEHATVIYACKQIEEKKLEEEDLNKAIETIYKRLGIS